jgi:hypothetical protein
VTLREAAVNSPDAVANEASDPLSIDGKLSETTPAIAMPMVKMRSTRRQE